MPMTREDAGPWYQEPWPWLLMAGPAAVIVAGFATLWIAVASNDGLIVNDYYKQGLAINQTLQRDTLAAQRGYQAVARMSSGDNRISVQLAAAPGVPLPDMLHLRMVHPTRSGRDGLVLLRQDKPGSYDGVVPARAAGRRILMLEDTQSAWRLTGEVVLPLHEPAILKPASLQ